ncbi:hypothetical protein CLV30_110154 [Haloactinopolyspora alba]|uniref:Uncharacterized protein n=1 Tax=Haloactinopolyspora alba TaxID=648780 RepID=A0A2P8DZ54_9ACTN|nr:hypothetical protein [Haloactinopolyspora alba]PSL02500.1 hypothetical protein CLV30_110154 [Haloactinopolyspora alba]
MIIEQPQIVQHLRSLVMSVTEPDLDEPVRASRSRTVAETVTDLRDVAALAPMIGGSQAVDTLRMSEEQPPFDDLDPSGRKRQAAYERFSARRVADEIRAASLTTDTPGLLPRPLDTGTGTTGIGDGLPLIRTHALPRDFTAGGTAPVTPGVVAGDIDGQIVTEGTPAPTGDPITIANVGADRARQLAACFVELARQVRDWTDDAGNAMLDQALLDIADRAAESYIGTQLISAAGGTRTAGTDLPAALDDAESAAGAALNSAVTTGTNPGVLVINPVDWPAVRRAIGTSWLPDLPHPEPAISIGATAGTAIMVGPAALHLFAGQPEFMPAPKPATIGEQISALRPFYLAVRATAGVQTVTGIGA